jgi:hypothetical protein
MEDKEIVIAFESYQKPELKEEGELKDITSSVTVS